jgi:hypothetical protein
MAKSKGATLVVEVDFEELPSTDTLIEWLKDLSCKQGNGNCVFTKAELKVLAPRVTNLLMV